MNDVDFENKVDLIKNRVKQHDMKTIKNNLQNFKIDEIENIEEPLNLNSIIPS